jgi:hypothetical protein
VNVSPRVLRLLRYIADSGEVPLHVLIAMFWPDEDPPEAATKAERWVERLSEQNLVERRAARSGAAIDATVRLTPKAAATFERPTSATTVSQPRAWRHHAASLRYVEHYKGLLGPNERLVEALLEPQLRSRIQAGRATKRGETFESFPDVVLLVEAMLPDGSTATRRVAVEYVTSKYTSQDIKDKDESFSANYDEVRWVSDSARTKARVERLTGAECTCLA